MVEYIVVDQTINQLGDYMQKEYSVDLIEAAAVISTLLGIKIDHSLEVVSAAGGIWELSKMEECQLLALPRIGKTRAQKLFALRKWLVLMSRHLPKDMKVIRSPVDVLNMVQLRMSLLTSEELWVFGLNTKNSLQFEHMLYRGSMNSAVVRIGEVFQKAIINQSASIIVVHNHPSGDPLPSPEDVRVTEMIVEAGALLDIDVLDHLIIGQNAYFSLKERGLGFK